MDWLSGMIQQHQEAQYQQEMVNQQLLAYGEHMTKTKKKDVINYLQMQSGASMVEQIDEFETMNARHICSGSKKIQVLPKQVVNVSTSEGMLGVEYVMCPYCRLLLINKSCLWSL